MTYMKSAARRIGEHIQTVIFQVFFRHLHWWDFFPSFPAIFSQWRHGCTVPWRFPPFPLVRITSVYASPGTELPVKPKCPGLYPFIETWGLIHTRYHSISWRPWAFHATHFLVTVGPALPTQRLKNPLQHATPRRVQNFTETASHHPAALWIPFRPYCSSSKFLNWNLMYHISVFLSSAGIHCTCLPLYR